MRIQTHPGEVLLEEFMKPFDLNARRLSLAIGVPHNRILALVKGQRGVSSDSALRLARYFDTTPEFWMSLQTNHDLSVTKIKKAEDIQKIERRAATAPDWIDQDDAPDLASPKWRTKFDQIKPQHGRLRLDNLKISKTQRLDRPRLALAHSADSASP